MSFKRLTNEILIEIVKYASVDRTISSLRSLASVNQIINRIVNPMLYSHFNEVSRISVPKFLRTILSNPQLATNVRIYTGYGLSIGPSQETLQAIAMLKEHNTQLAQAFQMELTKLHGSLDGEFLDVSDLKDAEFMACRESLNMIEPVSERSENWMSRIRKGKWHALTSLVLLLLPNLEDVEMIDYRYDDSGDVDHALGIAARLQASGITSQFSLEHLTDVSLSAFVPEDNGPYRFGQEPEPEYLYFADVMPFLRLPSVESVAISKLSSEGGAFRRATFLPGDLNFRTKDLEINDTCLDMRWLGRFLRLFTSLRRFSYNHVAEEQTPDFLPQDIGKAIAHLRPCLEELEISSMCNQNGKYTTPREIGSLTRFQRLKAIDVEGSVLFGYPDTDDGSMPVLRLCDILPRALENLELSPSDSPCHEEHLRELLRVKDEKFPGLKRIKLMRWGYLLNDPKGLRREFKAKGVKLLL